MTIAHKRAIIYVKFMKEGEHMAFKKITAMILLIVGAFGEIFSLFTIGSDISHWLVMDYLLPYNERELVMLFLAFCFLLMTIVGAVLYFDKNNVS